MLFLAKRIIKRVVVLFIAMLAIIKVNSIGMMFISMLISLWAYALTFGVVYGAGFLILLFIHELGHVIAARVVGIRAGLPIFIPFIGAAVSLNRLPINAKMAANIAIGGPALGTISAIVCFIWYFWTNSIILLVLSYTAAILNLLNLIQILLTNHPSSLIMMLYQNHAGKYSGTAPKRFAPHSTGTWNRSFT